MTATTMMATNVTSSIFIKTLIYVMNQSSIQQDTSYNYYLMQIGKESNAIKCYGIYGCFELSAPWTSEYRPVSLFPEELGKIEPKYPLYTRANSKTPVYIDLNEYDVIHTSGIDPLKPVYMISHGYMEGGQVYWIKEMALEFLKLEDCSVIVIDWQGGSNPPYTQAVANIRLVGAMTAHLLADLARYTGDLKLDHVHCIGHSLGAHLSGYIGYTLQQDFNLTLGRITGLDPAEPHFGHAQPPVRLDRKAAKYVDVVHTDASEFNRGGLGMVESIGHVDYYPNGGTAQPGCSKSVLEHISDEKGSLFKGIRRFLGCNHLRSYEFFTESINLNKNCSFLTVSCESYSNFTTGRCFDCGRHSTKCIQFGYHGRKHYEWLVSHQVIRPSTSMVQYFITGDKRPFCRAHYRIEVKISNSSKSRGHGGEIGQLFFRMHSTSDGKGDKTAAVPLNNGGYLAPGATYVAVVATTELKQFKAVEVELRFQSSLLNPLSWRFLATPHIHIDYITIHSLELRKSVTVCSKGDTPLINFKPVLLISSYC